MLIWIASYPRSGSTYFRMAVQRLYPDSVMIDTTRGDRPVSINDPPTVPARSTMPCDADLAASDVVHFAKTHDLPDANHRAIYLVRDGRDVLVSYTWFSLINHGGRRREDIDDKAFRTAMYNLMMDRRSPYGVWSQNVHAWMQRPRTMTVRFEDLIAQPIECVDRVISRLRLPLQRVEADLPSFEDLHAHKPRIFRRGAVGSWRDEFPPDLLDLFWTEHGEGMRIAGYESQTCAPQSAASAERRRP